MSGPEIFAAEPTLVVLGIEGILPSVLWYLLIVR